MGNYSSLKLNRRIFAVLWLCIFSFCLYAQENRSYIVTAARDTEEAFEAAGNVIVITSDDIEKSGKSSLVEILENVANIQLSSISGTNQDAQVNMRGFGENAFGRVLVMIDGRRLNNPDMSAVNLNAVPVESIDRIEILDGSASALYGDNAVGGVINIITKESTQPLSLVGGFSVGNNWTTGTHFGYTASEGYSGFSMFVDNTSTDGWRERTKNKTFNALVSGYVDVTDKITIRPFLNMTDTSYELPGSLTKEQYNTNRKKSYSLDDDGEKRIVGGGLSFAWQITDNFSFDLPIGSDYKKTKFNTGSYFSYTDSLQKNINVRPVLRFSEDFGNSFGFALQAGYDFSYTDFSATIFSEKARKNKTSDTKINQTMNAPYVTVSVDLPYQVQLEGAARYDTENIKINSTENEATGDKKYKEFVYSGGFSVKVLDNFQFFGRVSRLFRYPFVDEIASYSGWGASFNKGLKAETGYDIQFGVKFRYKDMISGKINCFYMPMEDEIWYNAATFKNENYAKTLRTGFNADISFSPVKFVAFRTGVSYINANFVDGTNAAKFIPLVSPWSFTAAVDLKPVDWLVLTSDLVYRSGAYASGDISNKYEQLPSFMLANITMNIQYKGFQFTAKANNILDTKYSTYTGVYEDYITGEPVFYYYPAQGRNYSLSLSYRKQM